MARGNGAVLLIFAFALVVFHRGFLKADVDEAEAFALATPTLRGAEGHAFHGPIIIVGVFSAAGSCGKRCGP